MTLKEWMDEQHPALIERERGLCTAAYMAGLRVEREACAKIADAQKVHPIWLGNGSLGLKCHATIIADAIRARINPD